MENKKYNLSSALLNTYFHNMQFNSLKLPYHIICTLFRLQHSIFEEYAQGRLRSGCSSRGLLSVYVQQLFYLIIGTPRLLTIFVLNFDIIQSATICEYRLF